MKKIIALLLLIITFGSCERDDICSGETPTTPHLIIKFYNINNPDETLSVPNLRVYGEGNETNLIGSVTSKDSIILPLKTTEDITRFVLHKDYSYDDNGTPDNTNDDIIGGNQDIIEVIYQREEVFVSRACGYKTIFNNVEVSSDDDGDNWISQILPNNPITIENETEAQVFIGHQ